MSNNEGRNTKYILLKESLIKSSESLSEIEVELQTEMPQYYTEIDSFEDIVRVAVLLANQIALEADEIDWHELGTLDPRVLRNATQLGFKNVKSLKTWLYQNFKPFRKDVRSISVRLEELLEPYIEPTRSGFFGAKDLSEVPLPHKESMEKLARELRKVRQKVPAELDNEIADIPNPGVEVINREASSKVTITLSKSEFDNALRNAECTGGDLRSWAHLGIQSLDSYLTGRFDTISKFSQELVACSLKLDRVNDDLFEQREDLKEPIGLCRLICGFVDIIESYFFRGDLFVSAQKMFSSGRYFKLSTTDAHEIWSIAQCLQYWTSAPRVTFANQDKTPPYWDEEERLEYGNIVLSYHEAQRIRDFDKVRHYSKTLNQLDEKYQSINGR